MPPELKKNFLEVGTNGRGEVVINHPNLVPDENGVGQIVFSVEQARSLANLMLAKAADAAVERGDFKTKFVNSSRRMWSEDECRLMVNAALIKLINDAGGRIAVAVSDMFRAAEKGTLAMSLSDDDNILSLIQVREI